MKALPIAFLMASILSVFSESSLAVYDNNCLSASVNPKCSSKNIVPVTNCSDDVGLEERCCCTQWKSGKRGRSSPVEPTDE